MNARTVLIREDGSPLVFHSSPAILADGREVDRVVCMSCRAEAWPERGSDGARLWMVQHAAHGEAEHAERDRRVRRSGGWSTVVDVGVVVMAGLGIAALLLGIVWAIAPDVVSSALGFARAVLGAGAGAVGGGSW